MTPEALRLRIARRLPVRWTEAPLALAYHAAGPKSGLAKLAAGQAPYWAYLWPGGAALIAHLAAQPALVRGKRVLDLGAGSGLVGIAAARCGARKVLASEIDPLARIAMSLNAALNFVTLDPVGDVLSGPPPRVDLILVGDLFYDPDVARRVTAFLARAGVPALVGDIGRDPLPRERLERVAEYPVREVGEPASAPAHPGTVWRFRP